VVFRICISKISKKRVYLVPSFQEYERMVLRMPGVMSAQVYQEEEQEPRVHVVAQAIATPRQMVRQVVSLLRNMGWAEVTPEMVSIVQIAPVDDGNQSGNRLKIFGYSLVRAGNALEGKCRLGRGMVVFEGREVGGIATDVLAEATVAAVNRALGGPLLAFLDAQVITQSERLVVVAMIRFGKNELMTGSAIVHSVLEETVVRATLDAVNRRVVLYTGGKSD